MEVTNETLLTIIGELSVEVRVLRARLVKAEAELKAACAKPTREEKPKNRDGNPLGSYSG